MFISKSDYMLYLRHPAWLWIKKHNPELIPPVDAATQAMFSTGHAFEPYAESLFEATPVRLGFDLPGGFKELFERSTAELHNGTELLLQPGFKWQNFFFIADIVQVVGNGKVNLFEIKSSTGVKAEHLYDLAFQVAVLEQNGCLVEQISIIHVNNKYVRKGDVDARGLCKVADVTEEVRALALETSMAMTEAFHTINLSEMPDPSPENLKMGSKSDWMAIYNNIVPQEPKVWPSDLQPTLNHNQLQNFLHELQYPLYFLDYETMQGLVPYFDGHRPYQQIPFQYSLHVIDSPGAKARHVEYLHEDTSNPVIALAEHLLADIGQTGSIITWNLSFEKTRNREMAEMLPGYADRLLAINDRVVDLMIPFKSKWYDDPRCEGSSSIKKVLPVVCPDLSYNELGIKDGATAQSLWMDAVLNQNPDLNKTQILSNLRTYCHLDTWAMVRIWEELVKVTSMR